MDLEHELKNALRRTPPEPGLAGRVLARCHSEQREESRGGLGWRRFATRSLSSFGMTHSWRAVAAAAVLVAIIGGWGAHEAVERRRGEEAKEQVMLALRIAGEKVRVAQQELRRER